MQESEMSADGLRTMMLRALERTGYYKDFSPGFLAELEPNTLVSYYISNALQGFVSDADDVRELVALTKKCGKPDEEGNYDYEGEMTVICPAPEFFVFQCLTHFLPLDEEMEIERARIKALFIEAGFPER